MNAYIWYGRFVATTVLVYSVYLLSVSVADNISGAGYSALITVWILAATVVGMVAAALFLLSFDGPTRFRTLTIRRWSWIFMFVSILLPTSISFFLAPLTAATIGLIFVNPNQAAQGHPSKS